MVLAGDPSAALGGPSAGLRMTLDLSGPPSLNRSVSCHAAPPGPGVGMLPMTHPCSVMVSEERAVRGEGRVEPSPEGPWSLPSTTLVLGDSSTRSGGPTGLRMTVDLSGPPSLNGSVSSHAAPPGPAVGMLPMTHPCAVMVSEELAVRGEGRVEPSPEGPWDASHPRLWCSRGILRLAPADLRSLRMTGNLEVPLSPRGPVSSHETPPRRGVGMLRMTWGKGRALPPPTAAADPRSRSRRRCRRPLPLPPAAVAAAAAVVWKHPLPSAGGASGGPPLLMITAGLVLREAGRRGGVRYETTRRGMSRGRRVRSS